MQISVNSNFPEFTEISLPGSKSISNRYLIIKALSEINCTLIGISEARDTLLLKNALDAEIKNDYFFADGGTPYRFFLAYAAAKNISTKLTGSEGLYRRQIAPLVNSLTAMGAEIAYTKNKYFPPVKIKKGIKQFTEITIDNSISSQFASALMLIAPAFEGNKFIYFKGTEFGSKSYIQLTADCMKNAAINVELRKDKIIIKAGNYKLPQTVNIEPDWSSAAWFYMFCAATNTQIKIKELSLNSIQGDVLTAKLFEQLGVQSAQTVDGVLIQGSGKINDSLAFDLSNNIDLAPALICTCVYLNKPAIFHGLENLVHKESNRIVSLNTNLQQLGWQLTQNENEWLLKQVKDVAPINTMHIKSFSDHRIAMAFSIFALKHPVAIDEPNCVEKSFPAYWDQLKKCNFVLL
jgi:3-phosphoshikimate 1-carboxyvinyltransferase